MKFILPIITLLIFLLFAGCNTTEDCRENLAVKMKIGLHTHSNSKVAALTLDSVWVNGLAKDSFLYKNSKSQSSLLLDLDASKNQSDFIVRFNNTKDTLSVFYSNNNAYFISFECGCIPAHTIEEVISTHHYIDSIQIIQREVTNVNAEHLKIFHN